MSKPRFSAEFSYSGKPGKNGDWWVYDDDFGYDASMMITGDFVDDEKQKYAEAVAAALNAAGTSIPIRRY